MRPLLTAIVILASVTTPAFAHNLIVVTQIKGDRLHIEAFYGDDTPAQQAKITVLNGALVVAEGRTDEKGVWSISKPMPGTYLVKAESLGHAAKETLVIADPLPGTSNASKQDAIVGNSDSTADEDRAAKTRTPWNRIGLGLGLIIGVTVMSLVLRRKSPKDTSRPE